MKPGIVILTALLLAVGCSSKTSTPPDAAKPAGEQNNARKAAVGEFGLDLKARDVKVKPGDDFFAYANGRWLDTFQIPEDRSAYGNLQELNDESDNRMRKIIEDAAAARAAPGSPEQKIGDYYTAFMDEAGIEARDLAPVKEGLASIDAAKSKGDIARLFGLPGYVSTFAVDLPPDLKDPDRYSVAVGQSGLGLPDRDYYLQDDPTLKEIRAKYLAYIEKMLTLGGAADAKEKAQRIMAFETAIAKAQWSIEQQRDVDANYNPRTRAQLLEYARGFEWPAFFEACELGSRQNFVLSELTAIRDIAKLFEKTPLETLKAYLTFHYLSDHAQWLPQRFDAADFDFYGRTLRGQPKQLERWKRGVELVNERIGELVGQLYVRRHFPPESKAKMEELVGNLRTALRERINALTWMTPETKQRAQEKLASFVTKIGYPDRWKDYSALEVRRDDLIGNIHRAALWDWRRQVARLDQPVDRMEWQMPPQTVNAYYNQSNNEIVFPAAILQPPLFDPNADPAVNYGGIGAVIGHEIGHGFDDQGRKFAPDGSRKDWWTQADSMAFTKRTLQLVQQYSQFEALPGLKVNGAITVGENIGDLGGLSMAHYAYKLSLKGSEPPVLEGLTGEQRLFLAWAQAWRTKMREGRLREQVMSDVHSPPQFRVNGVVRNIDAWYSAFNVQPDEKLFLKPEERVSIW